jgi:hypothetical protein
VGARALPEHLVSLDLEIKLDRDAFYVPKFRVHQRLPRGDRQLEDSEETGGKRKRKLKN